MSHIRRFDHVGITVADLDAAMAFFVGLGLEVAGSRMFVEGEFLDTVIGIPDSRTEIVMLCPPDGGTTLELSSFVRPDHQPGSPAAMANELGLRKVAFEVDDLRAAVDQLADGVRARARRDHRFPGSANRLTPRPDDPANIARELAVELLSGFNLGSGELRHDDGRRRQAHASDLSPKRVANLSR